MSGRLEQRKTKLSFQTGDVVRERGKLRQVVIEAHPLYAEVRLSGLRSKYLIPWSAIHGAAVKMYVEAARREKAAAKKQARRAA